VAIQVLTLDLEVVTMKKMSKVMALLAAVPVVTSVGCSSLPKPFAIHREADSKAELNVARIHEQQGRLGQAREMYLELIKHDKNNVVAYHRLGVIAAKQGETQAATGYFEKALALDGKNIEIKTDYAYLLYTQQQYERSEGLLAEVLRYQPDHKRALNNMGMVAGTQKRYDEALAYFRKSVGEGRAHSNVAYLLTQQGDLERAQQFYSKAISLDPENKAAGHALVQLHQNQQKEAAMVAAREAKGAVQTVAATAPVAGPKLIAEPVETEARQPEALVEAAPEEPATTTTRRQVAQAEATRSRPVPEPVAEHVAEPVAEITPVETADSTERTIPELAADERVEAEPAVNEPAVEEPAVEEPVVAESTPAVPVPAATLPVVVQRPAPQRVIEPKRNVLPVEEPSVAEVIPDEPTESAVVPVVAESTRPESTALPLAPVESDTPAGLAALCPDATGDLLALCSQMSSPDASVRKLAVNRAGRMGPRAVAVAPAVMELCRDEDRFVRTHAAIAVWKIRGDVDAALPPLTAGLKDSQPGVRSFCAAALGEIGRPAAGSLPALKSAIVDQDTTVRVYVAEAICRIDRRDAVARQVLIRSLKNQDAMVRETAAYALANLKLEGPEFSEPLAACLSDQTSEVRAASAFALGELADSSAATVQSLKILLGDSDKEVRIAAKLALSRIEAQHASVQPTN
jgi:Tfp pilus assembly protein PilF/HEAT repeat protein